MKLPNIDLELLQQMNFFFDYLKKDIKDKRKMGHFTILK